MKKARILFYDIETSPLKAYIWGLGKQVVRHNQLDNNFSQWGIICVTYCWNDNKPAKCIDWGYEEQNTAKVVAEFDEIIKTADHIIGKNNKRFDDKMLNASRMLNHLPSMPKWALFNDDLEQQMRKHFRLPSQSLDYISEQLGLGGKIRMEFKDWIDIVEKTPNGLKALNKMCKYGKKDVMDTRALWNKLVTYIEPKFDMEAPPCINCGSYKKHRAGFYDTNNGIKRRYRCAVCRMKIPLIQEVL